jgi:hypothetical protein
MVTKYLARDHDFAVSSTSLTGPWQTISGISEWKFNISSKDEDVSTFDAGAWGASISTQRTGSLDLTGFYAVDPLTGTRDPGQLSFERASMQVGFAAQRYWRVRAFTTSGGEIGNFVFTGTPSVKDYGGKTTDVMPFGGSVTFIGAPVGSGKRYIAP